MCHLCSRTHDQWHERHLFDCLVDDLLINSRHSSIRRIIRWSTSRIRVRCACFLTQYFLDAIFFWRNILINILYLFVNVMFCICLNQNDWRHQWLTSTITCDQQLAAWKLLFLNDHFWDKISWLLLYWFRSNLANLLEGSVRYS